MGAPILAAAVGLGALGGCGDDSPASEDASETGDGDGDPSGDGDGDPSGDGDGDPSGDGDGDPSGDGDGDPSGDGDGDPSGDGDGDPSGDGDGDPSGDGDGDPTGDGDGDGDPAICGVDSCTGETVWSRRYGNSQSIGIRNESVDAIAVDPAGNLYIAGSVQGSIELGAAGTLALEHGGYVAKLDPEGEPIWAVALDGETNVSINDMARDVDGHLILTGSVNGDLSVAGQVFANGNQWDPYYVALDADGNFLHAKVFASAGSNNGRSVAVAPDGRFALSGRFSSTVNFGGNQLSSTNGSPDAFVAVFEQDGTHVWSKRAGDASTQDGYSVAFVEDGEGIGDVVLAGYNYGTIDWGGDPHPAQGAADLFVTRLGAAAGAHLWTVSFADQNNGAMGEPFVAVADGRIFLTQTTSSANDKLVDFGDGQGAQAGYFFLAALDLVDGSAQWSRPFTGLRGSFEVAADAGNSVVIVGVLEGSADFGGGSVSSFSNSRDIFAAKYDVADGSYRWSRHVGDYNQQSNNQSGYGVAFDDGGHVYVGGSFAGVINWDDGELTSGAGLGGSDGFVAKLLP